MRHAFRIVCTRSCFLVHMHFSTDVHIKLGIVDRYNAAETTFAKCFREYGGNNALLLAWGNLHVAFQH